MSRSESMSIQAYARLRLLVAYLGEKPQDGWWDTSYLNPTGKEFLELNFPRSALSAGVSAATSAGKKLHDERIGKSRVYHLFRLPFEIEVKVQECILTSDQADQWALIESRQKALDELARIADRTLDAPEGPVCVGEEKNILGAHGNKEIARHYSSAFGRGVKCLPYFTAETNGGKRRA